MGSRVGAVGRVVGILEGCTEGRGVGVVGRLFEYTKTSTISFMPYDTFYCYLTHLPCEWGRDIIRWSFCRAACRRLCRRL